MKKLLSLLLALLLLTGCAAQPAESVPKEPDAAGTSEITDPAPSADMQPEETVLPESTPEEENAPEAEDIPPENIPAEEAADEDVFSPEDFDLLVKIQPYDWYGAPEPDGLGAEFGTVALTADQQAELALLLQTDQWQPAEDLPPVGLTAVMSLESSATGERLDICLWDDATLIMFSVGHRAQRFYFAPTQVCSDAQAYMYDAAAKTVPSPEA